MKKLLLAIALLVSFNSHAQRAIVAGEQSPGVYINFAADSSGNMQMVCVSGCSGGGTVAATQSGTWTVQPGNTANTTAWLVTGTGGTFPVTGTFWQATQPISGSVSISGTVIDPCSAIAKTNLAISQATSTQILAGTSAKKTYICSITLIAGAAENVSITAGTGSVCATGASAIVGSTTVANGLILAANGGYSQGNGGATIASGTTNADNICILQSGSVRISGNLTYVQQ